MNNINIYSKFNSTSFNGLLSSSKKKEVVTSSISEIKQPIYKKVHPYILAGLMLIGTESYSNSNIDYVSKIKNVEYVDLDSSGSDIVETSKTQNPYQLNKADLKNAPSPAITIAGQEKKAGIVVDVNNNKLYRYDTDGNVVDGYVITTGAKGRNGKSITPAGIRVVNHVETYPYKSAPMSSKRRATPKAFGPKILILSGNVNTKTGEVTNPDGIFIHGNNNESQLGKHASHGCIRLPNEQAVQFAREVPRGTYVKIINE